VCQLEILPKNALEPALERIQSWQLPRLEGQRKGLGQVERNVV
jgi:hypothetical protein